MKKLFVVTHGKAEADKPDPSLTNEAELQMSEIRNIIAKEKFALVIVGVGRRHQQTFELLFSEVRKPEIEESELVGVPETLSSDKKTLIFPDGRRMTVEEYARNIYPRLQRETSSLIKKLIKRKGANALVIGGRIVPHVLGVKEPTSGTLYVFNRKLELTDRKHPYLKGYLN